MTSEMVRSIAYDHIVEVAEEQVLNIIKKHENPMAVNFWMDNCPPCNLMKPKIRLAARGYYERINIYSVRLTEGSNIMDQLGIDEIPTILIFNQLGKIVGRLQGLVNQNEIISAFDRSLRVDN